MKTKKVKGFTLIELIVVIAIIGVLAAILVPSMLGYVKKSKIQAANTAASSIYKALNSALTELDEEDKDLSGLDGDSTAVKGTLTENEDNDSDEASLQDLYDYALPYFEDLAKTNCAFYIENGTCKAVGAKSGSYYGTYPKLYTAKNYDEYDPADASGALEDVKEKNNIGQTNNNNNNNNNNG